MYFYLIIAVQLFCAYHAYKHQKEYYWFLLIFFLPAVGCIIYIITQVYTKDDVDRLQKDIGTVINPTKEVNDLKARLEFSNSYSNRIALADAYFEIKDYRNAMPHYKHTLSDKVQDSYYAKQQLILCYFELDDFQNVIKHAEDISNKDNFKGSKQQFYYGLALNAMGKLKEAEVQLQLIDKPYSNYNERLELAKFYITSDNLEKAKILLTEIYNESQYMTKPNRRLFKTTITEVERLLKTL